MSTETDDHNPNSPTWDEMAEHDDPYVRALMKAIRDQREGSS